MNAGETNEISSAPPLRTPMIGLAGACMLGCGIGLYLPVISAPMWGGLALCFLGVCLLARTHWRLVFLYTTVIAACALYSWVYRYSPSERALANQLTRDRETIQAVGVVLSDPEPFFAREGEPAYLRFPVRLERTGSGVYQQYTHDRVLVILAPDPGGTQPRFGDRVQLTGIVQLRDGPGVGLSRTFYRIYVAANDWQRLESGQGNRLFGACLKFRRDMAERLTIGIEGYLEETAIFHALLLGYRSDMPEELNELFAETGSMHALAISGLHIGILALLVNAVLGALGVSRNRWIIYLLPVLILFTVTSGMRASAVRALIMATLYWGAPFLRRQPHAPSALAAAVVIVLLIAPVQLVDPGFIFSFSIVAGLLLLGPLLLQPIQERLKPDEMQAFPDSAFTRWWKYHVNNFAGLAMISLAAWLVSIPLTALYFHRFTPVALAGNLIVVPGALLIVASGMLSMVLGTFSPLASEIFNHAARGIIWGLIEALKVLQAAPGAHRLIAAPPIYLVVGYYGCLLWLALRKRLGGFLICSFLFLFAAGATERYIHSQRIEVQFLPTPRGQATLCIHKAEVLLIDAGPAFYSRRILQNFQRSGISHIDTMVLTHADASHVGGAVRLIEEVPVGELWVPKIYGRSKVFAEVLALAEKKGIPLRYLAAGDTGMWDSGVSWEVFHPYEDSSRRKADDASLVFRIAHLRNAMLFCGGAGSLVEQRLLSEAIEPSATVLVLPATQDEEAVGTAWLELIQPSVAVQFPGSFNRAYYAEKDITERLDAAGIPMKFVADGTLYDLRKGEFLDQN